MFFIFRNLFTKDDPVESDKRLMENWVTMGKMQELKGKLEKLSITKKDKKPDDESEDLEEPWWDLEAEASSGDCANRRNSSTSHEPPSEFFLRPRRSLSDPDVLSTPHNSKKAANITESRPSKIALAFPAKRVPAVNEGASCSGMSVPLNNVRPLNLDGEGAHSPLSRPLNQTFFSSMRKARKEAENIIRLQSKSLSVVVDSHSCGNLKRTPLPDIRRSPRPERLPDDTTTEEKKDLRGKTGSRMTTSSFAIVEEESDMAAGPSICSSQSSLVALPSNDDVVVALSPISRDHGSASMGRSRFRVSRYVLENAERPKTTPTKMDQRGKELAKFTNMVADADTRNRKHVMCSTVDLAPSWYNTKARLEVRDPAHPQPQRVTSYIESHSKNQKVDSLRVVVQSPSGVRPSSPPPPPPPPAKKKAARCLVCKKRLNITNTHTCRCTGIFCSMHRYSETHDCHFDYKEEGKHLLRLANPLVTAPKLPKI